MLEYFFDDFAKTVKSMFAGLEIMKNQENMPSKWDEPVSDHFRVFSPGGWFFECFDGAFGMLTVGTLRIMFNKIICICRKVPKPTEFHEKAAFCS